jgi:hypothetical protein
VALVVDFVRVAIELVVQVVVLVRGQLAAVPVEVALPLAVDACKAALVAMGLMVGDLTGADGGMDAVLLLINAVLHLTGGGRQEGLSQQTDRERCDGTELHEGTLHLSKTLTGLGRENEVYV